MTPPDDDVTHIGPTVTVVASTIRCVVLDVRGAGTGAVPVGRDLWQSMRPWVD